MPKIHKKVASATKKVVHRIKRIIKGFTIIELIIVIAIVAVLAGIVLVNVTGYIAKSKDSKVMGDISQIAKSLQIYKTENGSYSGYTIISGAVAPCDSQNYALNSNSSQFAIYHKLCSTNKYWCGDSTGALSQLDNPPDSGVYTCSSGSGVSAGGCGSGPACSQGYTCYNNSVCIPCAGGGVCLNGEDCRCTIDCACATGTCGSIGSSDMFTCGISNSFIQTQFLALQTDFNNKYNKSSPHTFYSYCYIWNSAYNYSELNNLSNNIKNNGYSFKCAESDEVPEGLACYDHNAPNGYFNTKWYAIACDNTNNSNCYCTDSTGVIVAGSNDVFTMAGLNNCACR